MFSWDIKKASSNKAKHGVSFEEAVTVFTDPEGLDFDDPQHSAEEKRLKRLGVSLDNRVLLVVYTVRELKNGKETIRIISARQGSKKEKAAYARL